MEANHTPCSIEVPPARGRVAVPYVTSNGSICWHSFRRRDFSPWLTPGALEALDPDGREAALFLWAVAQAAAVNNEMRGRHGRRPE